MEDPRVFAELKVTIQINEVLILNIDIRMLTKELLHYLKMDLLVLTFSPNPLPF